MIKILMSLRLLECIQEALMLDIWSMLLSHLTTLLVQPHS